MASKHVIPFAAIASFFKNDSSLLRKGENSFESGYVRKMIFDAEVDPALLKGEVQASMKNRSYTVEISLDYEDGIIDAKCTCPRGQLICHHMAALCIYGHNNISVTDKICAWNAPKTMDSSNVSRLEDICPVKKSGYQATQRRATIEEVQQFREELGQSHSVGFSWLLKPAPSTEVVSYVTSIEAIIFSKEYLENSNKKQYFLRKCSITPLDKIQLASATIGQASNANWLVGRKHRLTSSNFGPVLSACRRNKYPRSLFLRLTDTYDLSGVQAIEWGVQNEPAAIRTFTEITGLTVEPTGLWLDDCGFLGTSPDGFVSEKCTLEVKCPFKYRSASLQDGLKSDKSYIIYVDNEEIIINRNHTYFHQIQGQLFLTDRDMCYLVIWTPKECEIVRIARDDEWKCNIDILKQFYLDQYISFVGGTVHGE